MIAKKRGYSRFILKIILNTLVLGISPENMPPANVGYIYPYYPQREHELQFTTSYKLSPFLFHI